jgi:hypothetical protein
MHNLFQIVIIIVVLLVAYWVAERFSPDPLVTKIVQVIIFLVALWVIIFKILPMAGVSF